MKQKVSLILVLLLMVAMDAMAHGFRLPITRQMEDLKQSKVMDMPNGSQAPLAAPTQDDHGIITAPDQGVTKYYNRAGTGYYVSNSQVYNENQSGIVTIVEAEGGKVYIKDPVSHYRQNTWVEGTRVDNTITVAAGQPLAWNGSYSTTLSLHWGNHQNQSFVKSEGDITFTVDDEAGTISLNGSSEGRIIGIFWDDDNSWSGYGDYGTVWTLNPNYQPPSTDLIVLPDGATVEDWYADGSATNGAVPTDVKVAFVGNEVYIRGLSSHFPTAWIKGTLDGTTVTFSMLQFVGTYNGTMSIWAVGVDQETENLQAFTMTYDSEAGTLTLDENQLLVFNADEGRMYYLNYIQSLVIYAEEPAPPVIDSLPYVNGFDDNTLNRHFTIINANADDKKWEFYNSHVRYSYSSINVADDWLVSPAIVFVAGKKYSFSIDARAQNADYPERLEVRMAGEKTAEALAAGVQLIEPTVVNSSDWITLEDSVFTVSETGQYYIGIHAISDADRYYLYVDNFKVDTLEAPKYTVAIDDGDVDTQNWTINPATATTTGVAAGIQVQVSYSGTRKVKSVTAVIASAYTLLSAATTADLGKVVCAAGHLHDANTAVPDGCTAVGILGKVTETGHGLIIALQDATSQAWNTINGWTSETTYAGTTLKVLPDDAARGTNLTSYTTLGETAVSNWAVAQKSDYEAIFTNLGSTTGDSDGKVYDANVNAFITTGVGGSALFATKEDGYWPATEYPNGSYGWCFKPDYWNYRNKDFSIKVWPVLGF